MAGAYFVGRLELLRWINELTGLNYSKIEQTASGVFACHVFDALYPGSIRMEKVKFAAKRSHEYVHNYKILQGSFNSTKLRKKIDVEKLIKGKYQDNLEFVQWIKAFYDNHASEEALNYDGRARRENIINKSPNSRRSALAPNRPRLYDAPEPRSRPAPSIRKTGYSSTVPKAEYDALKKENEGLRTDVQDSASDREFYFNKLRDVELIIQSVDERMADAPDGVDLFAVFEEVKATLYASDEQDANAISENEAPVEHLENDADICEQVDVGEQVDELSLHDEHNLLQANM